MSNEKTKQINIVVLIICIFAIILFISSANINLPGIHQGYAPEQPIAYSHRLHAGDLEIPCLYCHSAADKSRHAGIPAAGTCMNCHKFVTAGWDQVRIEDQKAQQEKREMRLLVSDELVKLYQSVGFNTETLKYDSTKIGEPIQWIRVHTLPDFVYFNHANHVNAGVTCQTCHGRVETMDVVSQENDLTMGWCVNCHRDVNNGIIPELKGKNASINCVNCHY